MESCFSSIFKEAIFSSHILALKLINTESIVFQFGDDLLRCFYFGRGKFFYLESSVGVFEVIKIIIFGVSFVAQWLMILTSLHEAVGSIPSLAQWVKDLALL